MAAIRNLLGGRSRRAAAVKAEQANAAIVMPIKEKKQEAAAIAAIEAAEAVAASSKGQKSDAGSAAAAAAAADGCGSATADGSGGGGFWDQSSPDRAPRGAGGGGAMSPRSSTRKRTPSTIISDDDFSPDGKPPPSIPKRRAPSSDPSEYCGFCCQIDDVAKLLSCSKCANSGHQECLQMDDALWKRCNKDKRQGRVWHCIECKDCSICDIPGNDDALLFCDTCDKGVHMYCLDPPVYSMPDGDYMCPECATGTLPKKKMSKTTVNKMLAVINGESTAKPTAAEVARQPTPPPPQTIKRKVGRPRKVDLEAAAAAAEAAGGGGGGGGGSASASKNKIGRPSKRKGKEKARRGSSDGGNPSPLVITTMHKKLKANLSPKARKKARELQGKLGFSPTHKGPSPMKKGQYDNSLPVLVQLRKRKISRVFLCCAFCFVFVRLETLMGCSVPTPRHGGWSTSHSSPLEVGSKLQTTSANVC